MSTERRNGCIQFMQMNVTRIGSIRDQYANVRGYSTQILDNVSARDYAHRSRTNWAAITSGIITVISKNVGLIIKWDKIIDRRFGSFSRAGWWCIKEHRRHAYMSIRNIINAVMPLTSLLRWIDWSKSLRWLLRYRRTLSPSCSGRHSNFKWTSVKWREWFETRFIKVLLSNVFRLFRVKLAKD